MASGVPVDAFAREIGLKTEDLLWLAGRKNRKLEGEPTVMWERLMGLLNRKLGEIMEIRIEIETREGEVRRKRVAARMERGRRG